MATIKDVASKAGVSITTVSRVMNDRGPLSEATKKAVHDAMEELRSVFVASALVPHRDLLSS